MSAIVPSSQQPIADASGNVTTPWVRFFNALVANPGPISAVSVTGSPFTWTASQAGTLMSSGGTITGGSMTRSGTTIPLSGNAVVVANGDVIVLEYSSAPTLNFVPA